MTTPNELAEIAMMPEGNNVYGYITAPQGLQSVLQAVKQAISRGQVYIKRSGFDGAETLRLRSESADFETDALGGGEHLFNGGVGGSLEEVIAFVQALSKSLSESGIEHSFEVYDDQQLVQQIPG